jgi:hypothetical protein
MDACGVLPAACYGKYTKSPRQPQLVASEFADAMGYLKLRTQDGSLVSAVDINRRCWAVYYPTPYSMQIQPLLSYFNSVLKPFVGCRDIILKYQSLADKKLILEYSTGSALVQGDLDLFFGDAELFYVGCVIGRRSTRKGEWWFEAL